MLHTYFEYDFIDVALIQSIFTLEKALKMRYVELGNRLKRSNTLEYLINWFDKGYFETGSVSEIHSLRDIRNKKVHEIERHDKGLLYIKAVYSIFDLVNDLYEDRELREVRKKEIIETQVKLGDIYKDGCIFEIRDKRFIGFQAIPVFYNNKPGFNELSLNLWLIFDPNFVSFEWVYAKNCVSATVTDWSFANDGLVGHLKEDGAALALNQLAKNQTSKSSMNGSRSSGADLTGWQSGL